jgi:ABC-2 type transport system permease protein
MKVFLSFVQKEFYHVLRDRRTLLILFGMPLAQILIFGFALTNEIKNADLMVLDYAGDEVSQEIISHIEASKYFDISVVSHDMNTIEDHFKSGSISLALLIPHDISTDMLSADGVKLQIIADATDPNTATTLTNYLSNIIRSWQKEAMGQRQIPMQIVPEIQMRYNPQLKGAPNFVPGVMALILMLICVMMTAISIVREKEMGTMEVLLVSPFKPVWVLISKLIPYLILSLVNVGAILLISWLALDLPIKGSLGLLMGESMLFIMTCLSLGLLISVIAHSQQVAMLISLMGMLVPTLMLSGFMFPIENMPLPLQYISNIVPAKWYYQIVKAIMIKGEGLALIGQQTLILGGMTLFFMVISLRSFKIRLQ